VSSPLAMINICVRNLIAAVESRKRDEALRLVDQLDDHFDALIQANAPERITDERFQAAEKAIREVSEKIEELRALIINGRYKAARRKALDVQSAMRQAYRLLLLIRAGAPTPVIFQLTPRFLQEAQLRPPEELVFSSPLATQIYNIVVRRGSVPVEEVARELGITKETMDEFNRAITSLIQRGFVRPALTPDNRLILQAAR